MKRTSSSVLAGAKLKLVAKLDFCHDKGPWRIAVIEGPGLLKPSTPANKRPAHSLTVKEIRVVGQYTSCLLARFSLDP